MRGQYRLGSDINHSAFVKIFDLEVGLMGWIVACCCRGVISWKPCSVSGQNSAVSEDFFNFVSLSIPDMPQKSTKSDRCCGVVDIRKMVTLEFCPSALAS